MLTEFTITKQVLSDCINKRAASKILDVGSTGSPYRDMLISAVEGNIFLGVDLRPNPVFEGHVVDFFSLEPKPVFDYIIFHRTLEFMGTGAYGNPVEEGPIAELAYLKAHLMLREGGAIFLTLPVGFSTLGSHTAGPVRVFAPTEVMKFTLREPSYESYWVFDRSKYAHTLTPFDLSGRGYNLQSPLGFAVLEIPKISDPPEIDTVMEMTGVLPPAIETFGDDPYHSGASRLANQLDKASSME